MIVTFALLVFFLLGILIAIFSDKLVDFQNEVWEKTARFLDDGAEKPYVFPAVQSFNSRSRKIEIWLVRAFGILFAIFVVFMWVYGLIASYR
jgi:preprotein translocase subunit SecG